MVWSWRKSKAGEKGKLVEFGEAAAAGGGRVYTIPSGKS